MFVVLLTYVQPLELVDRHMKAHMAFVRACYRQKIFIVSGRQVPRTGGVILARAPDKNTMVQVMEQDPFVREGVATYSIVEFNTSQCDPDFKVFTE